MHNIFNNRPNKYDKFNVGTKTYEYVGYEEAKTYYNKLSKKSRLGNRSIHRNTSK
jgi:hypothetical protein